MTAAARAARRERLKLVEPAETETITRIIQNRLRVRREVRGARDRRQVQRAREEAWIDIKGALTIENADNPANLLEACRLGKVRQCFRHKGRWWWTKPVRPDVLRKATIFERRLIGADGSELENEHWQFQINLSDWRQHVGGPSPEAAAPASEAEPTASMPPAQTPASSSAPSPQADQPFPPPRARTTKRTTIEEYTKFQNDYLEKYGVYASKKAERNWAKAKGCSAQHVRDELRPQYREGLKPAERAQFQSHSKKAQSPDDGR